MFDRIIRAIRLDRTLYREVADNPAYMNEAILIVVFVSILAAVGTIGGGIGAYIIQVFNGLLFGWLLWAVVAYFVGTQFFQGHSSIPEMMRVLAYANLPRLLGLFGFIPCIGPLLALAGWILSVVAGVIAIRESMEFDTTKAVITAVIGFLVFLVVSIFVAFVMAGARLAFGG
jgi:hypothetical protein